MTRRRWPQAVTVTSPNPLTHENCPARSRSFCKKAERINEAVPIMTSPIKILIIENDPSHLKLAHVVLSSAGYQVTKAKGAEQALDAIMQDRPLVVLLDLELPVMNGLALVRKLKADPETQGIHIVAITSYPEKYPRS